MGAGPRHGCGPRDHTATVCQYICTIVAEGQMPRASDHNFNTEKLIPSVTHHMKIAIDAGYSICIGGEEGGGYVYVPVQDAIFDPIN